MFRLFSNCVLAMLRPDCGPYRPIDWHLELCSAQKVHRLSTVIPQH